MKSLAPLVMRCCCRFVLDILCSEDVLLSHSMSANYINLLSILLCDIYNPLRSLPTDQVVPDPILCFEVELFCMYGLGASVSQCPLSIFCPVFSSKQVPALCRPIVPMFLYVVHRSFQIS